MIISILLIWVIHLKKSTKDITISIVKVISVVVVFSIVGDGLFSFKCILNLYWNNYFNRGRYFNSGCDVKLSLKCILNHYWNNYFNSGRYFNSGCNVMFSLKCILNHYWNNYFNSGRYFNSGCNKAMTGLPFELKSRAARTLIA